MTGRAGKFGPRGPYPGPRLARDALAPRVAELAAEGLCNRDISRQLGITHTLTRRVALENEIKILPARLRKCFTSPDLGGMM